MSPKNMWNNLNNPQHVHCVRMRVLRRGLVQFPAPWLPARCRGKTEADFSCRRNNSGDSWQEQKQNRSKRAEGGCEAKWNWISSDYLLREKQELVQRVQARHFPAELWGKAEKSCTGSVRLRGPDSPIRKAVRNFWECRRICLSLNFITEAVEVVWSRV